MAKILEMKQRNQFITKDVEKQVSPFLLQHLLKEIINKVRINSDQMLEIELGECPVCDKQMINLKDDYGKNVDTNPCTYIDRVSKAKLFVIYDTETDAEYIMTAAEMGRA